MSGEFQDRLSLLALGIQSDKPVDPDQPPLVDGNHLRWMPDEELGFPWHGFYLFRRESRPTKLRCLKDELRHLHPGISQSVKLATKLGILSSPKPLAFSDTFAPNAMVEAGLEDSLRFDLPEGVEANHVEVQIGFRATQVITTCIDFRQRALGVIPNPHTEPGATFTFAPASSSLPPPKALIAQLSGGPPRAAGCVSGSKKHPARHPTPAPSHGSAALVDQSNSHQDRWI